MQPNYFPFICRKKELDRVLNDESTGEKIPVIFIANKSDLLENTQAAFVAGARMEKACQEHNFSGWFVTSAKEDENIAEAMNFLTKCMLTQRDDARRKAMSTRHGVNHEEEIDNHRKDLVSLSQSDEVAPQQSRCCN